MANQANSNINPITTAVISPVNSVEAGIVRLSGSFQGNSTSAPTVFRGAWFSAVTLVSTGIYRVQCNLNVPTLLVAANTPSGLLEEPMAWIVSETVGTQPASAFTVACSCYDVTTNVNSFNIYTSVAGTLTNVTNADRVFFKLAFKNSIVQP